MTGHRRKCGFPQQRWGFTPSYHRANAATAVTE